MSPKESDARPLLLAMYKSKEALEKHEAIYPESIEDALLQLVQDPDNPQEFFDWCEAFLQVFVEQRKGHSCGQAVASVIDGSKTR